MTDGNPKVLKGSALRLVAFASAMLLAGCGPLISFGEGGPADDVFSLRYEADRSAPAANAPVIFIDEPLMTNGLGGTQIAVQLDGNKRSRLQGARWSENSGDLIRDFVARAAGEKSGARVLGQDGIDVRSECRLGLKVWAFELVPGGSPREDLVSIEIEFTLVRAADNALLGQPVFATRQPVRAASSSRVVNAFHAGMMEVADVASAWLKDEIAACKLDDAS